MMNLSSRFVPAAVLTILSKLQQAGYQAYLVGGCVRDSILGKIPKDWDIATSAIPSQVQNCFTKVLPTGIQHGTVTVLIDNQGIEVTTYRTDGPYYDGRRPEKVEFHTEIQADLGRRDFTINAIAWDPIMGVIVDPFCGQEDLQKRMIKSVGDPIARFSEDGLRCIRAIRFSTVLDFEFDQATIQSIPNCIPIFCKISNERIRAEFDKILLAPKVDYGLRCLLITGLLNEIIPEFQTKTEYCLKQGRVELLPMLGQVAASLTVRLPILFHYWSIPTDQISNRLRILTYPTEIVSRVLHVVTHMIDQSIAGNWSPFEIRKWGSKVGRDTVDDILAASVGGGDLLEQTANSLRTTLSSNTPLSVRDLAIGGNQIMQILNLKPSKKVGEIAKSLLDLVLLDPEKNTVTDLTKFLQDHYQPATL